MNKWQLTGLVCHEKEQNDNVTEETNYSNNDDYLPPVSVDCGSRHWHEVESQLMHTWLWYLGLNLADLDAGEDNLNSASESIDDQPVGLWRLRC